MPPIKYLLFPENQVEFYILYYQFPKVTILIFKSLIAPKHRWTPVKSRFRLRNELRACSSFKLYLLIAMSLKSFIFPPK